MVRSVVLPSRNSALLVDRYVCVLQHLIPLHRRHKIRHSCFQECADSFIDEREKVFEFGLKEFTFSVDGFQRYLLAGHCLQCSNGIDCFSNALVDDTKR